MRALYFYHDPNVTVSAVLRGEVVASGISFNELNLAVDLRCHNAHRGGPMVLIELDGQTWQELPIDATAQTIAAAWDATPSTWPAPLPKAKIITKNGGGVITTKFTSAQAITIRAEIWTADLSQLTNYAGTSFVPFFDATGKEHYVKLVFTAGVAETTIAAGKVPPGKYRATKKSSTIADVIEHEIIIAY